MRVAALTSGRNTPSARFRIRQHIPGLRNAGVDVREYCPSINQAARLPGALGKVRARYLPPVVLGQMALNLGLRIPGVVGSYCADATWLERNFVPGLDDLARVLHKPLVLDIDDAIWLYNPMGKGQIARLVRCADMVFAGNAFLADWCSQYCVNVRVVPTAVDADRFVPRGIPKEPDSPFVIGWTGTSGNFRFLKSIEVPLSRFLKAHPTARLMVVADRPPTEIAVAPDQLLFQRWNPATEHLMLHEFDVGIMPLDDSDISQGKCSFKMLQYMAVGIPVIASPFGMNVEVLASGEFGYPAVSVADWTDALLDCFENPGGRRRKGAAARDALSSSFSVSVVSARIVSGLRDVTA